MLNTITPVCNYLYNVLSKELVMVLWHESLIHSPRDISADKCLFYTYYLITLGLRIRVRFVNNLNLLWYFQCIYSLTFEDCETSDIENQGPTQDKAFLSELSSQPFSLPSVK